MITYRHQLLMPSCLSTLYPCSHRTGCHHRRRRQSCRCEEAPPIYFLWLAWRGEVWFIWRVLECIPPPTSLPHPLITSYLPHPSLFLILPVLSSLSSYLLSYPPHPLSSSSSSQFIHYITQRHYIIYPSRLPLFLIHPILSVSSLLYLPHLPFLLILPMISSLSSQSSSLSVPFSYFLISSLPYLHHPSRPDIFLPYPLKYLPLYYYCCFSNNFSNFIPFLSQSTTHATFLTPKFICITYPGFLSSFHPHCTIFSHSALYRQFCSLRPVLGTVDIFPQWVDWIMLDTSVLELYLCWHHYYNNQTALFLSGWLSRACILYYLSY